MNLEASTMIEAKNELLILQRKLSSDIEHDKINQLLDAISEHEAIIEDIQSLICKEDAENIINELKSLHKLFEEFETLANIIATSARKVDQKIGNLRKCKDNSLPPPSITKYEEYREIIQLLSEGIHPFTGETFGYDHICQNSNITRALMAAVKALEKDINRQKRKKDSPIKGGQRWSEEEDKELMIRFNDGVSLKELADIFQRTVGSIRSRLLNYGILTQNDMES